MFIYTPSPVDDEISLILKKSHIEIIITIDTNWLCNLKKNDYLK